MKKLTRKLLKDFDDNKLIPYFICRDYILSESFIRDHQEKLHPHWNVICNYQILSEEFIIEFEDKISWINLLWNKNLSKYSKNIQRKIIYNSMCKELILKCSYHRMTDYMKEEYDKLRMLT